MSKDTFLSLYDAYIQRVYSHFYKSSRDRERALNYSFIFFAKIWDHCSLATDAEAISKIETLLQDNN